MKNKNFWQELDPLDMLFAGGLVSFISVEHIGKTLSPHWVALLIIVIAYCISLLNAFIIKESYPFYKDKPNWFNINWVSIIITINWLFITAPIIYLFDDASPDKYSPSENFFDWLKIHLVLLLVLWGIMFVSTIAIQIKKYINK